MKLFFRVMMELARGGALLALLLPQRAAVAEAPLLPATWVEFVRDSAVSPPLLASTVNTAAVPLNPVPQLIDEEDLLQTLGVPRADVRILVGIPAPEPSTSVMAGVAFAGLAGLCCSRSALLRRHRRN